MNKHKHDETVVLETFTDPGAANAAQAKLKAEGIDSFIHDENVMGLDPVAGIELRIFSNDIDKARSVLSITAP